MFAAGELSKPFTKARFSELFSFPLQKLRDNGIFLATAFASWVGFVCGFGFLFLILTVVPD